MYKEMSCFTFAFLMDGSVFSDDCRSINSKNDVKFPGRGSFGHPCTYNVAFGSPCRTSETALISSMSEMNKHSVYKVALAP